MAGRQDWMGSGKPEHNGLVGNNEETNSGFPTEIEAGPYGIGGVRSAAARDVRFAGLSLR